MFLAACKRGVCDFFFSFLVVYVCFSCMHSVARVGVSVSDEPAHVEAEGEEAGPQQVTQSSQVGDGEVVRVHASAPHPVDHPVRQVEKDYHLRTRQRQTFFFSFFFKNRNHRCFGVLKKQQRGGCVWLTVTDQYWDTGNSRSWNDKNFSFDKNVFFSSFLRSRISLNL